jgi:hypothetical protein
MNPNAPSSLPVPTEGGAERDEGDEMTLKWTQIKKLFIPSSKDL